MKGEDLVQYQRPTANDFWAAPDWALNVFNIHKQLYTVQLGRQRCTELSDRFAWLSTWDPADDGGEGSSGRERKTSTTDDFHYCILPFSQHPITARINWLCYLSFKAQCRGCWLFLPPLHALISWVLFSVLHTYKALFLLWGFNTFSNLQVKKKTSRSVAFEKDGHFQWAMRCVIRIYTLAYCRRCPCSPLSLRNRPVSGQGAWENVTLPWVWLMGLNHAF